MSVENSSPTFYTEDQMDVPLSQSMRDAMENNERIVGITNTSLIVRGALEGQLLRSNDIILHFATPFIGYKKHPTTIREFENNILKITRTPEYDPEEPLRVSQIYTMMKFVDPDEQSHGAGVGYLDLDWYNFRVATTGLVAQIHRDPSIREHVRKIIDFAKLDAIENPNDLYDYGISHYKCILQKYVGIKFNEFVTRVVNGKIRLTPARLFIVMTSLFDIYSVMERAYNEYKIIHMDLKPDNICVSLEDFRCRVIDFNTSVYHNAEITSTLSKYYMTNNNFPTPIDRQWLQTADSNNICRTIITNPANYPAYAAYYADIAVSRLTTQKHMTETYAQVNLYSDMTTSAAFTPIFTEAFRNAADFISRFDSYETKEKEFQKYIGRQIDMYSHTFAVVFAITHLLKSYPELQRAMYGVVRPVLDLNPFRRPTVEKLVNDFRTVWREHRGPR